MDQIVKDFYFNSFGIRVVDGLEVGEFFTKLNRSARLASKIAEQSLESISNVIENKKRFKDTYIKLEDSFFRVIASLPAKGYTLKHPRVVEVISDFLARKKDFTLKDGVWEQYDHLASWLIHLGTLFDVRHSTIKDIYLEAVRRSMATMSKEKRLGYSWQAYKLWLSGWASISAANRAMIREYINDQAVGADAQLIVDSID